LLAYLFIDIELNNLTALSLATMGFMNKFKDVVHKEFGLGSGGRKVFAHYMVRFLDIRGVTQSC
jgi:hypothetical protein